MYFIIFPVVFSNRTTSVKQTLHYQPYVTHNLTPNPILSSSPPQFFQTVQQVLSKHDDDEDVDGSGTGASERLLISETLACVGEPNINTPHSSPNPDLP